MLVALLAGALMLAGCDGGADDPRSLAGIATLSPTPDAPVADVVELPSITAPVTSGSAGDPAPQVSVSVPSATPSAVEEVPTRVPPEVRDQAADLARQLAALANEARAEAGLAALTWSECASTEAGERAGRGLRRAELEHESLQPMCGSSGVGENLLRASGSPERLHGLWMASDGHRANILGEFAAIGIACEAHSVAVRTRPASGVADIGGWMCVQVFLA